MASAATGKPVALIIAQGGLGDRSYNDSAYAGFQKAIKETGLKGRPVESKDTVAQANDLLRRASDAGFGLVIDLEYTHGQALEEVARDYADVQYVILNQLRRGANVTSVMFKEQEGSYLAGALAAMVAGDKSIKGVNAARPMIGVIGGTKGVGIDKFIAGYVQGARDINPDIVVRIAYSNTFGDPTMGLQMAKAMYNEGVSVIYQVAGGTGLGVIQAAKETGRYAIGVDTDQDGLAPGHVLTSVIKHTDVAVHKLVRDYAAGQLKGGSAQELGLKEGGISLSAMQHTQQLIPAAYRERVASLQARIVNGQIKVWNLLQQGYPGFMK